MVYLRTISLIPVSFPVGSLGLEEGRGGGISAPAVRGVVGLFGGGTAEKQKDQQGHKQTYTPHMLGPGLKNMHYLKVVNKH